MLMKIDEALKTLLNAGFTVNEATEPSSPKKFEEGDDVVMLDSGMNTTNMIGKVTAVEAVRGNWTYEIDWFETKRTNKVAEEGEDFELMYGTHGKTYTFPVIDVYVDFEPSDTVSSHGTYSYDGGWKQKNAYTGRFKQIGGVYLTKAAEKFVKHVHVGRIKYGDAVAAWKKRNPDVKLIKKEDK